MDKRELQKADPLKKQVNVSDADRGNEMSPMDAPGKFSPPSKSKFNYSELEPFFQNLMDEHKELSQRMERFKKILDILKVKGEVTSDVGEELKEFFDFFDREFITHNRKEEKFLFPTLKNRLLEAGEHSPTKNPITGVDVLEDEHIQAIQLSTICQHNLNNLPNILDKRAKSYLLHQAINKGQDLVELMDLHIFREDEIIFGLGQELLSKTELQFLNSALH